MTGISISLPNKLLNEFNEFLKENRHNSRINGLQDAMEDFINK